MISISELTKGSPILPMLEEVIEHYAKQLRFYAASPKVKPYYLKQQNETLLKLHSIYNALNSYKYLTFWRSLELTMERLEDSETGGHLIFLRTKDSGRYHSIIDINWFK